MALVSNRDGTSGTTQWDDIQRKFGNFEPLPKQVTSEEIAQAAIEIAETAEHPLEFARVDELAKVEDEFEEDTLEAYRRKRMLELKAKHAANKFGWVKHLNREDYIRQVNEAGEGIWVVLLLFEEWSELGMRFAAIMDEVAKTFAHVKFLRGLASKIVDKYPESNVPAVFLYRNGDCVAQLQASVFAGTRASAETVEWVLATHAVVETEIEKDPREEPPRFHVKGKTQPREKHDSDSEPEDLTVDRTYLSKRFGKF